MLEKNIENPKKLPTSINGQSTILFIFLLIPIIFFVPAIAIDLSAYQATKIQLQNALEVSADSALNKSIVDNYRSDKIIKLKDANTYKTNLVSSIQNNFHATIISSSNSQIKFKPGYDFTPNTAILNVTFGPTQSSVDTVNNGITIGLNLTTNLKLPVASKLLSLVGIDDGSGWSPGISITNNIYGIRVQKSDDFSTKTWQTYQGQ